MLFNLIIINFLLDCPEPCWAWVLKAIKGNNPAAFCLETQSPGPLKNSHNYRMTLDFSMSSLADGLNKKQTKTILQGTYLLARLVNMFFGPSIQWESQCYFHCLKQRIWRTVESILNHLANTGACLLECKTDHGAEGLWQGAAGLSLTRKDKRLSRKQRVQKRLFTPQT